ncbi:MAG: 50S ribosomal protein L29 [Clostridia bacterium]|nr:50S ribosomal protein L29 [Clostridia bacterium]
MKAKELEGKSVEELQAQVSALKTELFNLRFQLATGQVKNVKKLSEIRHDIARTLTVLHAKEQA